RECFSQSLIFAGLLSLGLRTHSSSHPRTPSPCNFSASVRTTALSFALWLRKISYWKSRLTVRLAFAFRRILTQAFWLCRYFSASSQYPTALARVAGSAQSRTKERQQLA